MDKPFTVDIVVVSYRNNNELIAFLRHLGSFPHDSIRRIVAVANGLDGDAVRGLEAGVSGVMAEHLDLIAGPQNPGYFGGAALGLEKIRASRSLADWIIVTNDDIRFEQDFFSTLGNIAADRVGVLAPDIVVPSTGLHQNPLYINKPPAIRLRLLRLLHQHTLIMRLYLALREARQFWRRRRVAHDLHDRRAIYAPHGACMVFNRRYFEAGGSLNYPCFLYGEEFFVAESALQLGLSVQIDRSLRVTHHEHSSTGLLAHSSVAHHVHASLNFLLREYYGK